MTDVPELLTVEEAARLARIGRTKAYAMTQEWRDTGGRSGLPVVDFGNVLRVPRRALEALTGAELTALPDPIVRVISDEALTSPERTAEPETASSHRASTSPTRRRHREPSSQLDLFAPTPPTS